MYKYCQLIQVRLSRRNDFNAFAAIGSFNMLKKYLHCATAFALVLTSLGTKVALGSSMPISSQSSQVQSNFDEPLCYMQTADGRVVDLQSLCEKTSPASTSNTPVSSESPRFRLSSGSGYASDSRTEHED